MNINATLVAQAINLFVTFWIVRFLLIKPVMAAIFADQEGVNALNATIAQEQELVQQTIAQREQTWDDARAVFHHEQPRSQVIADIIFKDIAPPIEAVVFSAKDRDSFIDQSAKKIVERLEYE